MAFQTKCYRGGGLTFLRSDTGSRDDRKDVGYQFGVLQNARGRVCSEGANAMANLLSMVWGFRNRLKGRQTQASKKIPCERTHFHP
jgi:hypothetical protein